VGNLSSPWVLLPFVAGWLQRSWRWAAPTGLLVAEANVIGFYGHLYFNVIGNPGHSHAGTLASTVANVAAPWLLAALAVGPGYAMLGRW
jgi:hypothetical protein